MIKALILALFVWISAVVFHELGHFFYARFVLKKNVEIRLGYIDRFYIKVGRHWDYQDISQKHMANLIFWGIFMGFVPPALALFLNPISGFVAFCFAAPGPWHDIKLLAERCKK